MANHKLSSDYQIKFGKVLFTKIQRDVCKKRKRPLEQNPGEKFPPVSQFAFEELEKELPSQKTRRKVFSKSQRVFNIFLIR
jgi:hypothetical protein